VLLTVIFECQIFHCQGNSKQFSESYHISGLLIFPKIYNLHKYDYTVCSLTNLNATVTSWLPAGFAMLIVSDFIVFCGVILVSYWENLVALCSESCSQLGSNCCVELYQ
jgi:hypothetical protein